MKSIGLEAYANVNVPPRCAPPAGRTVAQTALLATASPVGRLPIAVEELTLFVRGSIREIVPLNSFATQTAPRVTATSRGPSPTGTNPTAVPVLR